MPILSSLIIFNGNTNSVPGSSNIAPVSVITNNAPVSDITFSNVPIFFVEYSYFFCQQYPYFFSVFSLTFQSKFRPENTQRNLVFPNGILIIFVVLLCVLVCAWGDRSEG